MGEAGGGTWCRGQDLHLHLPRLGSGTQDVGDAWMFGA